MSYISIKIKSMKCDNLKKVIKKKFKLKYLVSKVNKKKLKKHLIEAEEFLLELFKFDKS